MEDLALRTLGISKRFGKKLVLNNLNIHIKKGEIYGFIGPNGAGKTTAMKIILGLLRADSGAVELFGKAENTAGLHRVGSLIESPGLYTNCTAYENMKRFSILCGGTEEDIRSYLQLVGLDNVGKKKVGSFSLGMKQRLGIAIALLGNPELLVLDEPVNGLDPMGMKSVRDIIQQINRERGVTFFISSHLLGELEKIANVYGIINKGVLVEEITSQELDKRCGTTIKLRCGDPERAAQLITQRFQSPKIRLQNGVLEIALDPSMAARVNEELVLGNIPVSELGTKSISYEDYFLNKMGMMDVGKGVGQYA